MSDHEEPGVPGAAEGSAEPTRSARVTAAQKEEQLSFMTEHPLLARHATDLSSALTRDEKQRLWEQLARRLNALGPPTKSSKQWKEHWSRRVMKARKRAAVLNEAARRTGGGSSTVCPLASSLARILTLVGADSAFGAPGVRVPAEPDDQQVREVKQQQAPDGSRAGALHLTRHNARPGAVGAAHRASRPPPPPPPRQSRQERHDAAAIQAVEKQALLLQQNTDQAAEEREFRGRLLEVLERISSNLDRRA
ncbi:hypothetical protein HPB47_017404 [Ixodes persulcatus]|uniref:Uncharacterized protein n=1 Tax=Ixodes persulcatus TaxID=34615 RepID=A0AC60R012_IXOPE|nr:hypothetical protein HPB47_017404 [Ixodes persulcatus]